MIRPVTLVTFLAFIGSGLYLYQVKHQAQLVDRQIRKVREATDTQFARAQVLQAEYALLNDPDRLAALAAAYLPDLKPTQPAQWSSMAEIDRRLPPIGGPTAEPGPLEPDAAHPGPAQAEPAPAEPPRVEPTPMATRTEPPRAERVARVDPVRPASHPTPNIAAAPLPAPASIPAARVAAARPSFRPAASAARSQPGALVARAQPTAPAIVRGPHGQGAAPVNLARMAPYVPPTQLAPPIVQVASAPLPAARLAPSLLPRVSPPGASSASPYVPVAARSSARRAIDAAPPATPAEAVARIVRGGPVDPSVPVVASALGMARTMLSVTPVSPANASTLYPHGAAQ